jgi:hypothetical protein
MESIPKVASFYSLAIQEVCICVLDNAVYLNKENGCQTFICNRYFNGIMSFEKHLHHFLYCALHDHSCSNALHGLFKDASDNQIMMIIIIIIVIIFHILKHFNQIMVGKCWRSDSD